jgi:hypothetical protein
MFSPSYELFSHENVYELKLYIPRMHITEDVNSVVEVFKKYTQNTANVRRVDFVALPEDMPESKDNQSAFVYLLCPIYYGSACSDMYEELRNNRPYRIFLNKYKKYWLILNNTKPVTDTKLNIHQIAENAQILETKVKAQEEIIANQEERIKKLEEIIQNLSK